MTTPSNRSIRRRSWAPGALVLLGGILATLHIGCGQDDAATSSTDDQDQNPDGAGKVENAYRDTGSDGAPASTSGAGKVDGNDAGNSTDGANDVSHAADSSNDVSTTSDASVDVRLDSIADRSGADGSEAGLEELGPADYTVEEWRVLEITLTSAQSYTDPIHTVTVDASFAGPDGTTLTRPAFWDGGLTYKIRFAAPQLGRWTMTTTSSVSDTGLGGVTQTINVLPYSGTLPIYQHGFVKVASDHHRFAYADGTPFFYMGDTHWEAIHERFSTCNYTGCTSQFQFEVDKRIAQGFTVYQAEWQAPAGANGPDQEAFYTVLQNCAFADSDLAGFANVDRKLQYLSDHGMVTATAIDWRFNAPLCDDDYLGLIGRYWAARYGAYPILWTVAQEVDGQYQNDPPNLDAKWQVVGAAIRANDAYQSPLTAHMCAYMPDPLQSSWKDKPYHDWFAPQIQDDPPTIASAANYWASGKPVVFYEPPYENYRASPTDERVRAYIAYQSGWAGMGYGVAGVWDDNYSCSPRDSGTPFDANCKPWYDGLMRESGNDMMRLRSFYDALPWASLVPRFDDTTWSSLSSGARLMSDGWKTYVAYFYNGDTSTGTLRKLNTNSTYTARWYDPRSGTYTTISSAVSPDGSCAWAAPSKPDGADWALVLQANDASAAETSCTNLELLATWPMDWNVNDASGSGHDGSATASFGAGKIGQALVLDGSGQFATAPGAGLDTVEAITVAAWVNLAALPGSNAAIINKEGSYRMNVGSDGTWHFELATGANGWYTAGTVAACSSKLDTSVWHHVAGTYDGNLVRAYLDGVLCGQGTPIAGAVRSAASSVDFGKGGGNLVFLDGAIDDVRIVRRALSDTELRTLPGF